MSIDVFLSNIIIKLTLSNLSRGKSYSFFTDNTIVFFPQTIIYGDLVSNQPEVLSRRDQYFDELLNDQFNEQLEAPLPDSVILLPPSIEETQKAIRRLKNNKAPATEGIAAELVKNGHT